MKKPKQNSDRRHVREKIRAAVILERLERHAMGEIEMTQTQIRAGEIALRKVIPDLRAIEISGNPDKPVAINLIVKAVAAK